MSGLACHQVNAVGAVGAQGGEEGVLGDDEDDIEFVESRPGASSSAMAGQVRFRDAVVTQSLLCLL